MKPDEQLGITNEQFHLIILHGKFSTILEYEKYENGKRESHFFSPVNLNTCDYLQTNDADRAFDSLCYDVTTWACNRYILVENSQIIRDLIPRDSIRLKPIW